MEQWIVPTGLKSEPSYESPAEPSLPTLPATDPPTLESIQALDPDRVVVFTPAESRLVQEHMALRRRERQLERLARVVEDGQAQRALRLPVGFLRYVLDRPA